MNLQLEVHEKESKEFPDPIDTPTEPIRTPQPGDLQPPCEQITRAVTIGLNTIWFNICLGESLDTSKLYMHCNK